MTHPWTRRTFLQTLGTLSTIGPWTSLSALQRLPRFAYIAATNHTLQAFTLNPSGTWTHTQSLPSAAAAALALSPNDRVLYVANAVDTCNHLPTGSIEAFAIDPHAGTLTLLNRQPLALFATRPSHLAVSPNGRHLAVAAPGGAAINLLPLHPEGSIGRVTASIKCLTAPNRVAFQDDHILLAASPRSPNTLAFNLSSDGALRLSTDEITSRVLEGPDQPAWLIHPAVRAAIGRPIAIALVYS